MAPSNKDTLSDTITRPHRRDDGPPEPPPPYPGVVPLPAPLLVGKNPLRVAMLDGDWPVRGFEYLHMLRLYLSRYIGYSDLSIPGSKGSVTPLTLCYRSFKCGVHGTAAREKPRYTDETETTLVPSPLDRLGPWEVEHPSGATCDWSREWEFTLSIRSNSIDEPGPKWQADGCLYFNGLSPHGDVIIPWNDPFKTRSVGKDVSASRYKHGRRKENWLKFTWKFIESSPRPRWGATITVYFPDASDSVKGSSQDGQSLDLSNPWVLLNPNSTVQ